MLHRKFRIGLVFCGVLSISVFFGSNLNQGATDGSYYVVDQSGNRLESIFAALPANSHTPVGSGDRKQSSVCDREIGLLASINRLFSTTSAYADSCSETECQGAYYVKV